MAKAGLTITAEDAEDLEVISARLQDAVARIKDLVYLPKKRRFAALFNRFKWEEADAPVKGQRVRAGLHFDDVLGARAYRIKRSNPLAVVSLLAVRYSPQQEGEAGVVELLFAGGGKLRLEVECLNAGLSDISGPWTARGRPDHERA